jgi:hypothetical protein
MGSIEVGFFIPNGSKENIENCGGNFFLLLSAQYILFKEQ